MAGVVVVGIIAAVMRFCPELIVDVDHRRLGLDPKTPGVVSPLNVAFELDHTASVLAPKMIHAALLQ